MLAGCASSPPGSASARTEVCKATSEPEVAALFDRWNQSLQTGDAHKVVANYADKSILLPTVSNTPRLNAAQKLDYFEHFLENKPFGRIDFRTIEIGCNTAVDAGLYTFKFAKTGAVVEARYTYTYHWDGNQWLITSHHSSAMPEK
nr:nuclear transport factor 2 family protein [Variovorax sp. PBL-E5]